MLIGFGAASRPGGKVVIVDTRLTMFGSADDSDAVMVGPDGRMCQAAR
jgi:hypothetical protein